MTQDLSIDDSLQFMYDGIYPSKACLYFSKSYIYQIWPELVSYDHTIHIIYGGLGVPHFWQRSNKSLEAEIRYEYNLGKKNFIFYCLDEGIPISNIFLIQETIELLKDILPNISLIYTTGASDGELIYKQICNRFNFQPIIHIIAGGNFEKNSRKFLDFKEPYNVSKKEKKFLCFNKVNRQHRITLLENLLNLNLVKDAYFSFYMDDQTLTFLSTQHKNEYKNIIDNKDKFPFTLNRTEERSNPTDIRLDDLQYFQNSYFSVVTETLFYTKLEKIQNVLYYNIAEIFGTFPSEKIFKCIALNHPFIVVSTNGYLKFLRQRGYKTFEPFIDETYDSIEDDAERLAAIIKEINRLCNLSETELIEFTGNIKAIVEYNSQHYQNMTDFQYTKNVLSLLK